MNIRLAHIEDAGAMVEFNTAMAFETEGKRLGQDILKTAVEAVFADEN